MLNFVTIIFYFLKYNVIYSVNIGIEKIRSKILHDEIFRTALCEAKSESYSALKNEVISMEKAIERFLANVFECAGSFTERDFQSSK